LPVPLAYNGGGLLFSGAASEEASKTQLLYTRGYTLMRLGNVMFRTSDPPNAALLYIDHVKGNVFSWATL
jgi:hypothetical protein